MKKWTEQCCNRGFPFLLFILSLSLWLWREKSSFHREDFPLPSLLGETAALFDTVSDHVLETALNQPYSFLGRGTEYEAFLSEDGKIVLKLFRLKPFRLVFFKKAFFSREEKPFFERLKEARAKRIDRTLASLFIAAQQLKEETALFYIHHPERERALPPIQIVDRVGKVHFIDPKKTPFILQRRADLLFSHFLKKYLSKDFKGARASIDALFCLIRERSLKEIGDRDLDLVRNFGFVGEKAVEIDLGSFFNNPHAKRGPSLKKELFYAMLPLRNWLEDHWPEEVKYLDRQMDEVHF